MSFITSGPAIPLTAINAKVYCTGDGVTDDRVGFQAAMTAAQTAQLPLFVPPGIYRCSRQATQGYALRPTLSTPLTIQGVPGQSILTLQATASTTPLRIMWLQDIEGVTIRDIVFDGNWSNACTYLLDSSSLVTLPQATLSVVSTVGFPSSGEFFLKTTDNVLRKITYTGITATSFTGCTGGTGITRDRSPVGLQNSQYGLANHATQAVWTGTVAAGSNGQLLSALTGGELHVNSTGSNASAGHLNIQTSNGWLGVDYTGKTATSYTGVTITSLDGTVSTGGQIYRLSDPKSHGLTCYVNTRRVLVENCVFRNMYGDGFYMTGHRTLGRTKDITWRKCLVDMCARNNVTISSCVEDVLIDDCIFTNGYTTAIDMEPEGDEGWIRNVTIRHCKLGSLENEGLWWTDHDSVGENVMAIGGAAGSHPQPNNYAKKITVDSSKLYGCITIANAVDVNIDRCELYALNDLAWPPLYITSYASDVWVTKNYVYDRSISNLGVGGAGAISVVRGGGNITPGNVYVRENAVHVRNAKDGIYIAGTGGRTGTTGTATALTSTVMTVAGAVGWVDNQFNACQVLMGGVLQTIVISYGTASVTGTPNTLVFASGSDWCTPTGHNVTAPAIGAFTIISSGGYVEVDTNTVNCINDGFGAGGVGIKIDTPQFTHTRYRVNHNTVRGANVSAIKISPPGPALSDNKFDMLEVTNNLAWDDQPVKTCVNGIEFTQALTNVVKLILRDNILEGVTNQVIGLSSGTWLIADGNPQRWTGYGSPEGVVTANVGSTFARLDGATGTVLYVKETGTLATGWTPYASPSVQALRWETNWMPAGAGNASSGVNGITFTGMAPAGTLPTGCTVAGGGGSAGTIYTAAHTSRFTSAAAAGSLAGQRVGAGANLTRGLGGGFRLVQRFGVADPSVVAAARMFVGVTTSVTLPTDVNPSTLLNIIGVGCDTGQTTMRLFVSGSTAQAGQDLGANFPVNTTSLTDMYEFTLSCLPGATSYTWSLARLNTGQSTGGTISTGSDVTMPAINLIHTPHFWRSNAATATAVALDIFRMYCVTDY